MAARRGDFNERAVCGHSTKSTLPNTEGEKLGLL